MLWDQTRDLGLAYSAASQAERDINLRKVEITDQLKTSHALMSQVVVHSSQAEGTLRCYAPRLCWGCEDPNHVYCNKKGNIICPKKDNPKVQKRAAAKREEYKNKFSARNRNRTDKRKISSLLSNLTKDKVKIMVLNMRKKPSVVKDTSKVWTFIMCVCLSNGMQSKPLYPINIKTNIPHISLRVGIDTVVKLLLPVTFNTTTVVCVGAADCHLALAKRYPQIVKSLVWAKDNFTPLTLSGVVNDETKKDDNKKRIVTMLKAVIKYHMPYKTKQGHPTLIKVALGEVVGVNTIMGMSMICPGKFNLDFDNNVVTSDVLNCEPFPVTYKSVQKLMPNFNNKNGNSTVLSSVARKDDDVENLMQNCIKDAFPISTSDKKDPLNPSDIQSEHEARE